MTIDYEHLLGKAYSTYKFAPLLQAVARIEEPFDIRQMLIFALSVAMDNEHSLLPWLIEENAECIQRMEGGDAGSRGCRCYQEAGEGGTNHEGKRKSRYL